MSSHHKGPRCSLLGVPRIRRQAKLFTSGVLFNVYNPLEYIFHFHFTDEEAEV